MPEILPDQTTAVTSSVGGIGSVSTFLPTGATGASATGGAAITTQESLFVSTDELGKKANYTVVIVIPIPFFNLSLNLDLVGSFILPALTAIGVPKAVTSLMTNINTLMQNVFEDIQDLITAIPEATVQVVVKLGQVVVVNFLFVAEKQPVAVSLPSFQLGLPNFAVNTDLSAGITIPTGDPIIIRIPIPVPIFNPVPLIGISGGNVSATAQGGVGSQFTSSGQSGAGVTTTAGSTGGGVAVTGPTVSSPSSLLPSFIQIPIT